MLIHGSSKLLKTLSAVNWRDVGSVQQYALTVVHVDIGYWTIITLLQWLQNMFSIPIKSL